jgi:hypothetical protein
MLVLKMEWRIGIFNLMSRIYRVISNSPQSYLRAESNHNEISRYIHISSPLLSLFPIHPSMTQNSETRSPLLLPRISHLPCHFISTPLSLHHNPRSPTHISHISRHAEHSRNNHHVCDSDPRRSRCPLEVLMSVDHHVYHGISALCLVSNNPGFLRLYLLIPTRMKLRDGANGEK